MTRSRQAETQCFEARFMTSRPGFRCTAEYRDHGACYLLPAATAMPGYGNDRRLYRTVKKLSLGRRPLFRVAAFGPASGT